VFQIRQPYLIVYRKMYNKIYMKMLLSIKIRFDRIKVFLFFICIICRDSDRIKIETDNRIVIVILIRLKSKTGPKYYAD